MDIDPGTGSLGFIFTSILFMTDDTFGMSFTVYIHSPEHMAAYGLGISSSLLLTLFKRK